MQFFRAHSSVWHKFWMSNMKSVLTGLSKVFSYSTGHEKNWPYHGLWTVRSQNLSEMCDGNRNIVEQMMKTETLCCKNSSHFHINQFNLFIPFRVITLGWMVLPRPKYWVICLDLEVHMAMFIYFSDQGPWSFGCIMMHWAMPDSWSKMKCHREPCKHL